MRRIGQRGPDGRGDLWKRLRLRGASASEPRTFAAAPAGSSSNGLWHATACWLFSQQRPSAATKVWHCLSVAAGLMVSGVAGFWSSALATGQAACSTRKGKIINGRNRSCLLYGDDGPIWYGGDAPIATPPVSPSGSTKYGSRPSINGASSIDFPVIRCRLPASWIGTLQFLVGRFCHDQSLPFKGDARNKALRT
jgi:hypothetical protein